MSDENNFVRPKCELAIERAAKVTPKYPVIDMHAHFGRILFGENYTEKYDTLEVVDTLKKAGVEKIVSLELDWGEQYDRMLKKIEPAGDFIVPFGSVDISKANEHSFEALVYKQIRALKAKGCKGIKLWKNITLYSDKCFGKRMRLDDERLSVVWKACGEENLPIVIHVADPPTFFEEITPKNEYYKCLSLHPEWSFYKPGIFSFEEHMEMQERVISSNPKTIFVVAHVGSYAENLKKVGEWLDAYSNMFIDVSARLDQLGRQPFTSKKFIEKYQERIMFGTDFEATFSKERTLNFYDIHFRFFQTDEEYFEHPFIDMLGQWNIYGLNLSDDVLKKIYRENAIRVLKV